MSARPKTEPADRRSTLILVTAAAAMIAVAVVVALVVTGGDDQSTEVVQMQPVEVSGTLPTFAQTDNDPAAGMTAPAATGKDFAGVSQQLPRSATPTMIVFAAHWCPHCQKEVPLIVDWMKQGKHGDVDVVLVSTGTNVDAPNYPPSGWLFDEQWKGRVIADDARSSLAGAYGLKGYPYIVFVDASGKVVRRMSGEQPVEVLDAAVSALVGSR